MRSMYIEHDRVQAFPVGASRTKQSFKEETEINNIVARYQETGLLDHINKHGPRYNEMPSQDDFAEAMNLVTSSRSMFNELPANLRNRFGNDPAQFLDFVGDENNREEMISLGLLPHPEPGPDEPELGRAGDPPEPPADPPADPPGPLAQ